MAGETCSGCKAPFRAAEETVLLWRGAWDTRSPSIEGNQLHARLHPACFAESSPGRPSVCGRCGEPFVQDEAYVAWARAPYPLVPTTNAQAGSLGAFHLDCGGDG